MKISGRRRNGATVVVDDDAQPGASRLPIIALGPEIKLGVIGLPDLVRTFGFAAVEQVVGFAVRLVAIESEGLQIAGDGPNGIADGVITRWSLAPSVGDAVHLLVYSARAERRSLQYQTFREMAQLIR